MLDNRNAMQDYDAALKLLLQSSANSLLRQAAGIRVVQWLNPELPKIQTTRADLLGKTEDGTLVHVELQSTNYPDMVSRMVDYALRIHSQLNQFPRQIVLYVGKVPMRMSSQWREPDADDHDFFFRYTLVDIRDLDGNLLLASPHIEDNVLAVLTRLQNQAAVVRQILERIARLDQSARRDALAQLLVISNLRDLADLVRKESKNMPILENIMEHAVLGPVLRQGREEGREEGQRKYVKRFLEKRFGPLPAWIDARLENLSALELDVLFERALDTSAIQDLFPDSK